MVWLTYYRYRDFHPIASNILSNICCQWLKIIHTIEKNMMLFHHIGYR
jgi:hypothetical protein